MTFPDTSQTPAPLYGLPNPAPAITTYLGRFDETYWTSLEPPSAATSADNETEYTTDAKWNAIPVVSKQSVTETGTVVLMV